VTRATSRKHRGYATQRLLADRWRTNGLFPFAKAVGAGEQGNDLIDTPGVCVEIKARDQVSLPAALRQADNGGGVPVVVWRHNGQGATGMDEWTVTMRLSDWERMLTAGRA
jgi:hypothetical protein